MTQKGGRRVALLTGRYVTLVEFDRHDAHHVFPVRLILEDFAQLSLGRFAR